MPLIEETIGAYFLERVRAYGDREFVVCSSDGVRRSWSEFAADCKRVAVWLQQAGYQPGERLGVWLPNHYEWLVTQFACHLLGLILVNVNQGYRPRELRHALNLVGVKGLVVCPEWGKCDYAAMLAAEFPELGTLGIGESLHAAAAPSLRHVFAIARGGSGTVIPGAIPFDSLLSAEVAAADEARMEATLASLRPDDAANIQFTSGTTGAPKAATLSHRNILNNGFFIGERLRYTEDDIVCIPVPLYHCFGSVLGTLACLTHGSKVVLPGPGFDPRTTLSVAAAERCTALYGVPAMFIAELSLEDFESFDLSSLRTGIMAGSLCPPQIMANVQEKMHMSEVSICYGMTETSPVSFQTFPDDCKEIRCETVGQVHPHVECKVVGEQGRTVPRGVPGELCTRGYVVMQGYWGNDAATAASIDSEGFMHTGDIATIGEDGNCRITGRIKDMIIRGGENIYPAEVENFLYTCDRIKDVQVVGAPDGRMGECVVAYVIPHDRTLTEADVKDYCAGEMAHFKIPRHVFFIEEMPLTVTGKVQKFVLRDDAQKRLSTSPSEASSTSPARAVAEQAELSSNK